MLRKAILSVAFLSLLTFSCAAQGTPAVNSTLTGCGTAGLPLTSTGSSWNCALQKGAQSVFQAKGVDLHTATGDVGTIAIPSSITRYQVVAVNITNCSVTPVLAAVGLFTGAGATGTTVVAATTITGATGSTIILNSTIAGTVATTMLTAASIFVNLSVANVAALTCDVGVRIQDWT